LRLDKHGRFFANLGIAKVVLNQGEDTSPPSFSPLPDLQFAESTPTGEQKDLFYENENFSHKKFNEPLGVATQFGCYPARADTNGGRA
jgi:hypothetical protein